MVDDWVVPLLGVDFQTDFDKMVVAYIQTNYNIADPVKTDVDHLRFAAGFFDFNQPYEICVTEQDTVPEPIINPRSNYMSTRLDINIRAERLTPNAVDPQLGAIEREIIRILGQYRHHNITGISDMRWQGGQRIYSHMVRDEYAEQDWRSTITCRIYFEKRDITPT